VTRAAQKPGRKVPSIDEVRNGPPTVDVPPAAALIGISKSYAYELLQRGEFPCRVIRVGSRWRVPKTALLELLGA
jgi:excisionase family DNA binding protein